MVLNRYRIDVYGNYHFHTFKQGQAFNKDVWLEDDGSMDLIKSKYYSSIEAKVIKEDNLSSLTVEVNGVKFDAHKDAIDNMNSTVNSANKSMFQLLASGSSASDAYEATFKTKINWKNHENGISSVQIETIVEALELAMTERAKIYGV